MKNKIIISGLGCILAFFIFNCNSNNEELPLGTSMKMLGIDTSGNGENDSFGYYLLSKGNKRIVYQEIDKNGDRKSDEFIWVGSTNRRSSESKINEPVKVYEESDSNNDGSIDTIRWFLPNDFISMVMKDSNKDGYFETTVYYSFAKKPVRTEIDSNQDGFADIFIWSNRAEIDTNFDKLVDSIVLGDSPLELEGKAMERKDMKPVTSSNSWHSNPKLVPMEERAIIGSGYFY
ncbi:hypothetical protein [Leptospira sp. GIMC2001]|uniref:hypothetical protein n=1 Tax=Leptospira sp. GIMC2001 TaxID=1513297 RepID=UPI0023493D36|nr:hypothetical protein [Leptospira sp. GIMC2001]WCL47864.1 hypothetical protein O4O04_11055 [Leptospira sp. GIMC2001]